MINSTGADPPTRGGARAPGARARVPRRARALTLEDLLASSPPTLAEAFYPAIFQALPEAVLVLDRQGLLLDANPACTALLGFTREELHRMRVEDLLSPAGEWVWDEAVGVLGQSAHWQGDLQARRQDGGLVPLEGQAARLDLPGGHLIVMLLHDLSHAGPAERLRREFTGLVAHELGNSLAALSGYADILGRRGAHDPRLVQAIGSEVSRLKRLVADLADFARFETGQLTLNRTRTDLVKLARGAAEQAQALSAVHSIRVEAPGRPLEGTWDPDRLGQVFQNLLTNAVKYSPGGGTIVVRLEDLGDEARVSVQDPGLGIAPEALPHLFDSFYRAETTAGRAGGLGLGLYISKLLVEAHGGRIWAESAGPGRGSTFTLTLPYGRP